MSPNNKNVRIDGHEVPPLVINEDYVQAGTHQGYVIVERGMFTLGGTLQGLLVIQHGVTASIKGTQQGSIIISSGAKVAVTGSIQGSITVEQEALLIIEDGGKMVGPLSNSGKVILRGVFGGSQSGRGEFIIEGNGFIKQPIIRNGGSHYEG